MLDRKIYSDMLEWKSRDHKCLLITGQRQVGKTYIVDAFAKSEYGHYIYINFNESPDLCRLFDDSLVAGDLIARLVLRFGSGSIVEGDTLIFLDEIQDCPRAYSSLKQFTEYGKVDVIASGSLMGVKLPKRISLDKPLIPMGYEETLIMRPLDFEEYLWARGISSDTIDNVRSCIRDKVELDAVILERFSELFREYMIVGGMPEAVDRFVKEFDYRQANSVHHELVQSCLKDINRYNEGIGRIKTQDCFESIPYQLVDSNKKFMYSRISGEGSRKSADRYMENILWVKDAGYGNFCYGLSQLAMPLKKNVKRDMFKVYLSDTGLLLHMYGDKAKLAIFHGDHTYNRGAIVENVVADGLVKCGYEPLYYRKDKGDARMELDFVLEFWDGIAVVELKLGNDREARSLNAVVKHFDIARRIILEDCNIHVDKVGIEHYPLFASAFLREMDPRPYGPVFS